MLGALGAGSMLFALVLHSSACQTDAAEQAAATAAQLCSLPCAVTEEGLIAERLVRYDGAFLENGSGIEVTDAAALMLRNTGDIGISWAVVIIEQGERTLTFEATQIPPNSAVLVLEKEGQLYSSKPLSDCYGWALCETSGWQPEEYLDIAEADMGSLDITNCTDWPLHGICLYYKTEYADGLFYLGGITYEIRVGHLEAGQTLRIHPARYASGSSRILRILFDTETTPLVGEGSFL